MIKRILILIILMALSGAVCWIVSGGLMRRSLESQFAAIELSEIAQDARASTILNSANGADNTEFDQIFIPKVITIAIFRPEVSRLNNTQLMVLCKLIAYRRRGGFDSIGLPMKELVFNYLNSSRSAVIKQLNFPQQNMQKARQALVAEHAITPAQLKEIESRDHANNASSNLCK